MPLLGVMVYFAVALVAAPVAAVVVVALLAVVAGIVENKSVFNPKINQDLYQYINFLNHNYTWWACTVETFSRSGPSLCTYYMV